MACYRRRSKSHSDPDPSRSSAIVPTLMIDSVTSATIPALCDQLRQLIRGSTEPVRCDIARLAPNLLSLELVNRLHLTAQQAGGRICFERASPALRGLIEFCGLGDTLSFTSAEPPRP